MDTTIVHDDGPVARWRAIGAAEDARIAALPIALPAAHTAQDIAPAGPTALNTSDAGGQDVTTRITYEHDDYACYATVDGIEEIIGYRGNHTDASALCREYRFNFYADRHTPERAAEIAMEQEPPAIYARPAEPAAELFACPCGAADPIAAALADDPNLFTATESQDHARRALQENICGQYLNSAYCDDPAGFLAHFDTWGHRTQAAVTRAVANFLGEPMGKVDEVWVNTRLMMMEQDKAPV